MAVSLLIAGAAAWGLGGLGFYVFALIGCSLVQEPAAGPGFGGTRDDIFDDIGLYGGIVFGLLVAVGVVTASARWLNWYLMGGSASEPRAPREKE
ncbi:hypothetical protein Pan189_33150 [Stratiformator vulcanicus]|uniref:Uncharacterized protein n=1 Tax=Stratiformator vulcanicus TaxID=2527980 RepID=A0A517R4V1_9PLAN|nr:hypothetical protein Pan189_33150 [Stratiformator vulcanicus]